MSAVSDDDPGCWPPPQCQTPEEIAELIQQAQQATKFGGPNSGSPPLLDFKSLLLPISEEEPAGGGVPFDVREQLEQARKEVNPEAFAPDDPLRPDDFVRADWKMIIGVTQDTLRGHLEKSACRRPAAGSTGQAIRPDGPSRRAASSCGYCAKFVGTGSIRLGTRTIRKSAPRRSIGSTIPTAELAFLTPCEACRLSPAGGSTSQLAAMATGQAGGASAELVERTIAAASRDQCQLAFDNLSQALVELRQLTQFLSSKLGPEATRLHRLAAGDRRDAAAWRSRFCKRKVPPRVPPPHWCQTKRWRRSQRVVMEPLPPRPQTWDMRRRDRATAREKISTRNLPRLPTLSNGWNPIAPSRSWFAGPWNWARCHSPC